MNLRSHLALLLVLGSLNASAQNTQGRDAGKIFIGRQDAAWLPKIQGDQLPRTEELEQKARKLAARRRNLDAFALPVFPREPSPKAPEKSTGLQRQAERITLNQALQTLHITAVNLRDGEFLVQGHEVGLGDTLLLGYKGVTFEAIITEVSPLEVRFKDKGSGETGVLPHRVMPRFVPQPMLPGQAHLQGHASPIPPLR